MKDVAADIQRILDETLPRLASFSEEEAEAIRPGGRWSRKEILGHLVDSAANNHQRFVRAQLQLEFVARDYVRHLRHHLEQILEPAQAAGKAFRSFAEP